MFRIHMLPAEDGDCFLIETGRAPHRVLVDGGRRATARTHLKRLLAELPQRSGPLIDLLVLTHIDADHIEGLLALMLDAGDLTVGEVWFNGLEHARIADGQAPPVRNEPPLDHMGSFRPVLSFKQAKDFAEAVAARRWPWNASLAGGVAMVDASGPLPAVPLSSGARLTLLGPSRAKLAGFVDEWEHEFALLDRPTKPVLEDQRCPAVPTVGSLEEMADSNDRPDTARPNGTSIAFVVEHGCKRALFCADAHPGDLVAALTRYGGAGRVHFDVVKAAHHGSAANNTSALIDRLESPIWLVSTNGSRHGHPEPEAIARIVLSPLPDKRVVFNYRTACNEVWANDDLAKHYRYQPEYPAQEGPTLINIF